MKKYAKALVALAVVVAAVGHALVDGSVSPQEWSEIGTAAFGVVGVFLVPNKSA